MKDTNKAGKQREELKAKVAPDNSTHKTIEKNETPVSSSGGTQLFDGPKLEKRTGPPLTISKPEAELLARKFADKPKETKLPLDETIAEVKEKNLSLREEKKNRPPQSSRIIADLRRTDPLGIKTCGRCSQRVKITDMDSKKELCEICAS